MIEDLVDVLRQVAELPRCADCGRFFPRAPLFKRCEPCRRARRQRLLLRKWGVVRAENDGFEARHQRYEVEKKRARLLFGEESR